MLLLQSHSISFRRRRRRSLEKTTTSLEYPLLCCFVSLICRERSLIRYHLLYCYCCTSTGTRLSFFSNLPASFLFFFALRKEREFGIWIWMEAKEAGFRRTGHIPHRIKKSHTPTYNTALYYRANSEQTQPLKGIRLRGTRTGTGTWEFYGDFAFFLLLSVCFCFFRCLSFLLSMGDLFVVGFYIWAEEREAREGRQIG